MIHYGGADGARTRDLRRDSGPRDSAPVDASCDSMGYEEGSTVSYGEKGGVTDNLNSSVNCLKKLDPDSDEDEFVPGFE